MNSPLALLSLIVALPLFGVLFALTSKDDADKPGRNAFNVCVFTLLANIVLIWRIFMILDEESGSLQLIERYRWLSNPEINIMFGVDTFSLLLILAVHLSVLAGLAGVRRNIVKQKSLMVFTLLFLSMTTGFFVAADIFSFYIFFEAMLIPLFMIIGVFGEVKKQGTVYRFFLYNFLGAIILFSAVMLIYHMHGSVTLEEIAGLKWTRRLDIYIWGAVFLAFLSRIPVWPFHYWISSVCAGLRNPLAFIVTALLPLTGIYGFIRFLPEPVPFPLNVFVDWISIIGIVTMLFIALIGFINKDSQYKIFSYITVYYILYLLGAFSGDEMVLLNIGFSLFSFMLIFSSLETLLAHILRKEEQGDIRSSGFLCKTKRLSFACSYLTIAAVGMPLSAIFINNFFILSKLLASNVKMGMVLIFSLVMVGCTLLQELFRLKTDNPACRADRNDDISFPVFAFFIFIMFILLMSFINPLWFVIDE